MGRKKLAAEVERERKMVVLVRIFVRMKESDGWCREETEREEKHLRPK